jgi:O-antigen/teichoic acid export membrane protein
MKRLRRVLLVRLESLQNSQKMRSALENLQNSQKVRATHVSVKRIVNNTAISLVGQLVTWASTLLLLIAYGRFLGDVKFGELYLAITFVGLVGFPVEFSFSQQLVRDVAQDTSKAISYLSNALLIKVALWFGLYGLLLLLSWLLGYTMEQRILVAICGLTLLSGSIASTFGSLHIAFERVVFPVVGSIFEKGLSALIGFLVLKRGAGVEVMACVLLGGSVTSAIWQASWFFRLVGVGFAIDWALIRRLVRTSIPFVVYGVLGVLYYRIDTVLLSLMTNTAVVGWYGAGYRLFDTLNFLPTILMTPIMYPVFSKLSTTSEEGLKLAIEKTMNLLLFFGIPMAMGLIFAAPNIVGFLYHRPEFVVHTPPALQALAPGLVLLYINAVLGTIIVSTKQEKKFPIMAAIALVFNLGLNLILIPVYQHVGAAIVTSLTELLLAGIAIVFLPKHLLPVGSWPVGVKSLAASLVMAAAILLLSTFQILVILPVAMLVYFGTATLLRTIPREDIQQLYGAIRRKAHRASTPPAEPEEEEPQITEKRPYQRVDDIRTPYDVIQQAEGWASPAAVGYQEEERESEITEELPRINKKNTVSPEVAQ